MTYAAATAYRDQEVLSASPERLVLIVFDFLLLQLRRAVVASQARQVEARIEAVGRARAAVGELLATLNVEEGGALARQLSGLYAFFMTELIELGTRDDPRRLERIAALVLELRSAFAEAAARVAVPA